MKNKRHLTQCRVCHKYPSQHKDKDHKYFPIWDGRIKFLKQDKMPAGLFWATYKDIEAKEQIKFKIENISDYPHRRKKKKWLVSEGKYSFQNDCTDKVYNAIREGKGGLILNATGSGKTRIAAMIASRFKCDILFVVDQLALLHQAQKEIEAHLGEKVGFVGESKFRLERVTVGTIQTLHLHRHDRKFKKWFRPIDIIIIDEIHDQMNGSNFDVIVEAKPTSVIGLTATLGLSKKHIRLKAFSLAGPILYHYPVERGMKEDVLSKGICVRLLYENHLDEIKAWTQPEAYRKRIVKNGERNNLIVKLTERAVKKNKFVIVGVERLQHLEEISERLNSLEIRHKIVAGSYKGKGIKVSKRMISKDRFERGEIRCLVVNKVFKKGIDIKRVDLIINGTGKPSANDVIQFFGRGLRKHELKQGLIYVDINDYDPEDKTRKKKNWLARAASKRIRALKANKITVQQISHDPDINTRKFCKILLKKAEKWLQKEIQK